VSRLASLLAKLQASFAINTLRRTNPEAAEPGRGTPAVGAGDWRPQMVLRPVSPLFIWFTLALAFVLNLLPWGRGSIAPDFLALALVFWNVREPRRVGIGAAFVFGLVMDVHDAALLGQHALAYSLLSYGAIALHRRILWFPLGAQSLYVLPLLIASQLASLVIRLWVGGNFPGWLYFVESLVGAALWPLATWLLLAPQRRSAQRDQTRPL
jgi:rod shape-determining protein MreD